MMEHLYDTHFHLYLQKDRVAAIREIEQQQIYTIAVTNLPDLYRKESVELRNKYIRFALGFHPELIHLYKKQIPMMWDFLPRARYLGEIGLDFVDTTYKEEQIAFFSELIERCRYDENKILTIHSRRAVRHVLQIIGKNFKFKPILHWFTGSKGEIFDAIDSGYYISVNNSMMTSKRFLSLLPSIPKDQLLLETDSPFNRKRESHSLMLSKTAQLIAEYQNDINLWDNFKALLK